MSESVIGEVVFDGKVRPLKHRPSPPGSRGPVELRHMPRIRRARVSAGPVLHNNDDLIIEVLDQGQLGSCELNGWDNGLRSAQTLQLATAMATQLGILFADALVRVKDAPPELAARLFMYFCAQAVGGYLGQGDTGTTSADVAEALASVGFCRESLDPYRDDPNAIDPNDRMVALQAHAYDQRFHGIARIDEDGMSPYDRASVMDQSLAGRYVVIYATPWDITASEIQPGQIWRGCLGQILGGHCVDVVAVGPANMLMPGDTTSTEECYLVLNSWGTSFCRNGRFLMAKEALRWQYDGYIVGNVPQFSDQVAA